MIFVFFCFFKKKGIKKEKKPVLEAFTDESSIVIRHERTEHILKKIKEKKKIKKKLCRRRAFVLYGTESWRNGGGSTIWYSVISQRSMYAAKLPRYSDGGWKGFFFAYDRTA